MHYKFDNMNPTTGFGRWLYLKMQECDMTCIDVADKLHITRQIVAYHVNGHHNPNYPFVVAYCWLFGDDPNTVWKLVEQDKAR